MLNKIITGVFDAESTTSVSISDFVLCVLISVLLGMVLAITYTYKTKYTKSFVVTLAMLPAVVCVVIMMVNGNIGTGITVAGAFSLVRFRSNPGTAKEIGAIFLAMGAGLVTGMGYLAYAILFVVIMCVLSVFLNTVDIGIKKSASLEKTLRITIPEDLNYGDVFEELFIEYTNKAQLTNVKTSNMGSLFKLTYDVVMKDEKNIKQFIDDLRCRNGNLEISMSEKEMNSNEL